MNRRDLINGSAVTTATVTPAKLSTGQELREAADEIAATSPTTWIVVSKAVPDGVCEHVPAGKDGREYLWVNPAGLARLERENEALAPPSRMVLNKAHGKPETMWGVPVYEIDGKTGERADMIRAAYAAHLRGKR